MAGILLQWFGRAAVRRPARAPVVSVIMPVYNGARWLASAIESVLAQTLQSLEVIVIDDASTDESLHIADRFALRDARVVVLRNDSNRGQAAARNAGIARARGEWIAPVDADDEIHPDRLRRLVEAGERERADLIADGILFKGERAPGTPAELMSWDGDGDQLERLSAEQLIASGTQGGCRSLGYLKPLMRRRFLNAYGLRYEEDLRFAEDFNLYARALFCGADFVLYPGSHYVYWQTPESASRTEVAHIATQAVANSQQLRTVVPEDRSAELHAVLDEYEQRWRLLAWFEQLNRSVAERRLRHVGRLLLQLPAAPASMLRFIVGRLCLRRRGVTRKNASVE